MKTRVWLGIPSLALHWVPTERTHTGWKGPQLKFSTKYTCTKSSLSKLRMIHSESIVTGKMRVSCKMQSGSPEATPPDWDGRNPAWGCDGEQRLRRRPAWFRPQSSPWEGFSTLRPLYRLLLSFALIPLSPLSPFTYFITTKLSPSKPNSATNTLLTLFTWLTHILHFPWFSTKENITLTQYCNKYLLQHVIWNLSIPFEKTTKDKERISFTKQHLSRLLLGVTFSCLPFPKTHQICLKQWETHSPCRGFWRDPPVRQAKIRNESRLTEDLK